MHLLLAMLIAQSQPAPRPPPQASDKAPLSKEDREVVKQMALLEQLELVKNLELFEGDKDGGPPPQQRQP